MSPGPTGPGPDDTGPDDTKAPAEVDEPGTDFDPTRPDALEAAGLVDTDVDAPQLADDAEDDVAADGIDVPAPDEGSPPEPTGGAQDDAA